MIQYILYHIILYNTILYHLIFNQINTSYWLPKLHLIFIKVVHLNFFKETVLHSKRALYWLLTKQKRRDKKNNFKIKTKLVCPIILFEKCTQHFKMLCQPFSTFQKCLCISSYYFKKLIRFLIFEFVLIKYQHRNKFDVLKLHINDIIYNRIKKFGYMWYCIFFQITCLVLCYNPIVFCIYA